MGVAFHFGQKDLEGIVEEVNGFERMGIIGAGLMGTGIGIDLLQKTNYALTFVDVSQEALDRAKAAMYAAIDAQVASNQILIEEGRRRKDRLKFTTEYQELSGANVIWEVATEREDIKRKIFERIEREVDTSNLSLLMSNTSSHTTGELAQLISDRRLRERFVTAHGYFPVPQNALFDVMKGPETSEAAYKTAVVWAEQVFEKSTIALPRDHHGYVADPLFQGMGQIVALDARTGRDIVEFGGIWDLFTANPLQVLDRTGHMPFTESSRHLGAALPAHDRLKPLYTKDGKPFPNWVGQLEKAGRTGVNSQDHEGFFKWEGKPGRERPVAVYDHASRSYVPIPEVSRERFASVFEARAMDHRDGKIKSLEGLLHVAVANDEGGRRFRRYVTPFMLYALDLVQDGYATPGQINMASKTGLKFKFGLVEVVDRFIAEMGHEGFVNWVKRGAEENPDWAGQGLFDVDGKAGAWEGRPSLVHTMKGEGWKSLLGYGRIYGTPVEQRDIKTGNMLPYYNDLRFIGPNAKDRTATIIFHNPLRGNVFNRYVLDQLDHAVGQCVRDYADGKLGAVLFTATGWRMLGADARQFNDGWFDRDIGYEELPREQTEKFTRDGMALFRFLQEAPLWTVGAFGDKWGGGAEFTYFLSNRFDLVTKGPLFDTIRKVNLEAEQPNYHQPELHFGILAGFGAVGELHRLVGQSAINELFMLSAPPKGGMTPSRAHQLGLSNGIDEDPVMLLARAYERARLAQKDNAPWSMRTYQTQMARSFAGGTDDAALVAETGDAFDPHTNRFVSTGILRLMDRGGRQAPMDLRPELEVAQQLLSRYARLYTPKK